MPLKWFARLTQIMTLAIEHITEYYDMNLATFGLDSDGSMVVAFPVFVKDHASEPKTLYEIEMVKVPIPDKTKKLIVILK